MNIRMKKMKFWGHIMAKDDMVNHSKGKLYPLIVKARETGVGEVNGQNIWAKKKS